MHQRKPRIGPVPRSPSARTTPPDPAVLTVEGSAILNGRQRWLSVGEAIVVETAAGRKLRMEIGAVPRDGKYYLSLVDVRRLDRVEYRAAAIVHPDEAGEAPVH